LRPELIEEARRLRERGLTYEKIGEMLGVRTTTIYYCLNPEAKARLREWRKEYRKRSEVKEREREYKREYRMRPEVRERTREYYRRYFQRPEVKERMREYHRRYRQNPEVKKRDKEYRKRPEIRNRKREYLREYFKRPEVRARLREYRRRPEVRERKKKYMEEYRRRPEVRERSKVSVFEILDLLHEGSMTIEEISKSLGKWPSVVRQVIEANAEIFEIEGDRVAIVERWGFLSKAKKGLATLNRVLQGLK